MSLRCDFFAEGLCAAVRQGGGGLGTVIRIRIAAGNFERARGMLPLGLQAGGFAQAFADADDVVVARAEAFVGVFVGVAGLVQRRADPFERGGEGHQLFVEFQSAGGDLLGVLVLVVVFPEVGDEMITFLS